MYPFYTRFTITNLWKLLTYKLKSNEATQSKASSRAKYSCYVDYVCKFFLIWLNLDFWCPVEVRKIGWKTTPLLFESEYELIRGMELVT